MEQLTTNKKQSSQRVKKLVYPFFRELMDRKRVRQLFSRLDFSKVKIEPGRIDVIRNLWTTYPPFNKNDNEILIMKTDTFIHESMITDYFVEKVRIHISKLDESSEYQCIMDNIDEYNELEKKCGAIRAKKIIRDKLGCGVSTFPISLAGAMYCKLREVLKISPKKNLRILDMSAGWGDRLIAAMRLSGNVHYCGVDPNPKMTQIYHEIVKTLKPEFSYQIIPERFEETQHTDFEHGGQFDIMFTSPPYFVLENYFESSGDKYIEYAEDEDMSLMDPTKWLEIFMFPSMVKIADLLRHGGIAALTINDINMYGFPIHYVHQIIKYINKKTQLRYSGAVALEFTAKNYATYQPVFLFRKE